jgi:xanthine dehydrogenase accessory factor
VINIYRKIDELLLSGERFAVATVVRTEGSTPRDVGAKMVIKEDGTTFGTIGGGCVEQAVISEAQEALKQGKHHTSSFTLTEEEKGGIGMICGGKMEVLIEVVQPKPSLLIIGSGHIAEPLAKLGHFTGFSVSVIDPFAKKERFPDADMVLVEDVERGLSKVKITPAMSVVIATRHKYDEPALRKVIHTDAGYIGLVGSVNRVKTIFDLLLKEGTADKTSLEKVHAPVGLDLGAKTVEEIAISIIAEVIKERRSGTGEPLTGKWRKTSS